MSDSYVILPVDDTKPFYLFQVLTLVCGPDVDERTGFVRPAEERRFQVYCINPVESCIGGRWTT